MDAFDADVLIYAVVPDHPLGRRVRALFPVDPGEVAGVGSVLLLPEHGAADAHAAIEARSTIGKTLLLT